MAASMWLRYWLLRRKRGNRWREAGFTLLELLIAVIISGIIISGLLALVTEMLRIERRETAVDNVQRDMKRAIEYIAADLSEAIFVYVPFNQPVDPADPPVQTNWATADAGTVDVIQELADVGQIDLNDVVLAFWRPDFLEDDQIPADCSGFADAQETDCENLQERRASYTLVVYEVKENQGNDIWDGQARLTRYELPKYHDPETMEVILGWRGGNAGDGPIQTDPIDPVNFGTWVPDSEPRDPDTKQPLEPVVLVDFVALPDDATLGDATCRDDELLRIPVDPATSRSFFACARVSEADNQNLEIFLRGDFEPRDGTSSGLRANALSGNSLLPTLRTNVFVPGVIGYDPN